VTGMETIKTWKSLYRNNLKLLRKEEKNLNKVRDSGSSHEVRDAEQRVASISEEISLLERRMLKSWTEED
jgi:hypothetical protein